jgi:hypothetical protein
MHRMWGKDFEDAVVPAGFEIQGKPRRFEVMTPDSRTITLTSGASPENETLNLGLLKIPTDLSPEFAGFIAIDGTPFASVNTDQFGFGTLTVNSRDIVMRYARPSERDGSFQSFVSNGLTDFSRMEFLLEDTVIGSAEFSPAKRVWIDERLPDDLRFAIATMSAKFLWSAWSIDLQQKAELLNGGLNAAEAFAPSGN